MRRRMSDTLTRHIVYRAAESENLRRTLKGLFKKMTLCWQTSFTEDHTCRHEAHDAQGKARIKFYGFLGWSENGTAAHIIEQKAKKGKFNLRYQKKKKLYLTQTFVNATLPQLGYRGPLRYLHVGKLMMFFYAEDESRSKPKLHDGVCVLKILSVTLQCIASV